MEIEIIQLALLLLGTFLEEPGFGLLFNMPTHGLL